MFKLTLICNVKRDVMPSDEEVLKKKIGSLVGLKKPDEYPQIWESLVNALHGHDYAYDDNVFFEIGRQIKEDFLYNKTSLREKNSFISQMARIEHLYNTVKMQKEDYAKDEKNELHLIISEAMTDLNKNREDP